MAIIAAGREKAVARTIATLQLPGPAAPELELALHGWIGLIDNLTLRWLEHSELPQERLLDLLTELFVGVLTSAGAVAAR